MLSVTVSLACLPWKGRGGRPWGQGETPEERARVNRPTGQGNEGPGLEELTGGGGGVSVTQMPLLRAVLRQRPWESAS